MMSRALRGAAAATALLVAVSATANAQEMAASRFAVYGGLSMPTGDFGDAAEMGFQIGGAYTMQLKSAPVNLRFNVDYSRYAISSDAPFDGNWGQLGLWANAVYKMKDSPVHFLGGLGFVNQSLSIDGGGSDSESDLAWNIGGGFSKDKWYLEARYQTVMADPNMSSIPIVFGWRF